MSPNEINNRIIQVKASIEQMKTHEHFNDMEKRDSINKLDVELNQLYTLQAEPIDVKQSEEK